MTSTPFPLLSPIPAPFFHDPGDPWHGQTLDVAGFQNRVATSHTDEPGYAVRAAVSSAGIDQDHFDHYQKIRDEVDFNDLNYAERRQKDRATGTAVPQMLTVNRKPEFKAP